MQGPPYRPKLRLLAERFLNRSIQAGEHDSVEDARAAMALALLKLRCSGQTAGNYPMCTTGCIQCPVLHLCSSVACLSARQPVVSAGSGAG